MPEPTKRITVFDAIRDQAQKIGFGEWKIKLIVYDGKVTGFDQTESPLIKFREQKEK